MPVFLVAFMQLRRTTYGKTGRGSACKWTVVALSLIFYAPFGAKNMAVLLLSVLFNALIARKFRSVKKGGIYFAVLINVAALLFFKFWGKIPGIGFAFFPVAVSFFTFSQISYLVDMSRGEIGEFDLPDYLSYILFFPKLLQGPLMGYRDFVTSLDRAIGMEGETDWERLLRGMLLFSIGLFKKVILADTFGKAVDFGYQDAVGLGSIEALLVAVFYSFQLYFDFSGYCDMAGGICCMIGFELPANFNSPYKAVNIVDFWKRWHITLTGFFTKYVYIPLGGNRRGRARMCVNFMIVFLLSGLWHGNGITFIVWGAMHGVLFVITRLWMMREKSKNMVPAVGVAGRINHAVKVLLTFTYVTAAWVFFRAPSVGDAMTVLERVFTGGVGPIATKLSAVFQLDELWYILKVTPVMKLGFAWDFCMWLFTAVAVVVIFFMKNASEFTRTCKIGVRTTLCTVFLMLWSILSFAQVSTFLYMNF